LILFQISEGKSFRKLRGAREGGLIGIKVATEALTKDNMVRDVVL